MSGWTIIPYGIVVRPFRCELTQWGFQDTTRIEVMVIIGTLLTLLQTIQWRNYNATDESNSADSDDIVFRISTTNYQNTVQYLNERVFTPSWSQTDTQLVDNTNDATIRSLVPVGAGTNTNAVEMKVTDVQNGAPGNLSESVFGSLADLHIGYVSASLTNAHEGRAIILNENDILLLAVMVALAFVTSMSSELYGLV